MQSVGHGLAAAEGAFGTQLLRRDLTVPSLRFDWDGRLSLSQVSTMGPSGFGLALDPKSALIPLREPETEQWEKP